ncbi:hypothetical protein HMF8227_01383 [Saliniradius amylolyticus]|uniref:DUF2066 domain-containing protein n=1 Tax=Saliniradius amylolyticus TaxID=2183582 RepID=A0A2S2E2I6_9ALTE|nr:DUF2066 domain-containing protein [Saliniradius amylolyticus]AWL11858.1 hypothetical protein HMF8227_01383 [Saliniradius amylolyticus]
MLRLAVILLMVLSGPTYGAVVSDLYQGRVAIDNQSASAQSKAMGEALAQVLVKVRGKEDILSHPDTRRQLRNADELLSQYRFEQQQQQLFYLARFDQAKVNQLIRGAGFPIWGQRRPESLLWLALDPVDGERGLVSEYHHAGLVREFKEQARRRGIVLRLPLMDLTDVNRVSALDVWGRFIEHIQQSSERYQPQVVFSARMYPEVSDAENSESEQWRADWDMVLEEQFFQGYLLASNPDALARRLVNALANQLAEQYATGQVNGQSESLLMTFDNVTSLDSFVGISRVLSSLAVVSNVSLKHIQGAQASYEVGLLGSEQDLLQSLSLEPKIQRQRDNFGQPVTDNRFIWVNND